MLKHLLQTFTRRINEATGSTLVRSAINAQLKEKATVLELKIDSQNKTIHAVIQVKGQPEPIDLTVTGYALSEGQAGTMLRWEKIEIAPGRALLPPGTKEKLEWIM
jgi:hypothetical protein